MITGIGVDIIEIERIQGSISKYGNRFLTKLFTEDEIQYCTARPNQPRQFAVRFAAKEALSKALSTGNTGEFEWKNIEVIFDDFGKPAFRLHRATEKTLSRSTVFLSISCSDIYVTACVIIKSNIE